MRAPLKGAIIFSLFAANMVPAGNAGKLPSSLGSLGFARAFTPALVFSVEASHVVSNVFNGYYIVSQVSYLVSHSPRYLRDCNIDGVPPLHVRSTLWGGFADCAEVNGSLADISGMRTGARAVFSLASSPEID